jgi:hypothetical protein
VRSRCTSPRDHLSAAGRCEGGSPGPSLVCPLPRRLRAALGSGGHRWITHVKGALPEGGWLLL